MLILLEKTTILDLIFNFSVRCRWRIVITIYVAFKLWLKSLCTWCHMPLRIHRSHPHTQRLCITARNLSGVEWYVHRTLACGYKNQKSLNCGEFDDPERDCHAYVVGTSKWGNQNADSIKTRSTRYLLVCTAALISVIYQAENSRLRNEWVPGYTGSEQQR